LKPHHPALAVDKSRNRFPPMQYCCRVSRSGSCPTGAWIAPHHRSGGYPLDQAVNITVTGTVVVPWRLRGKRLAPVRTRTGPRPGIQGNRRLISSLHADAAGIVQFHSLFMP
jgi:hypothetical protein